MLKTIRNLTFIYLLIAFLSQPCKSTSLSPNCLIYTSIQEWTNIHTKLLTNDETNLIIDFLKNQNNMLAINLEISNQLISIMNLLSYKYSKEFENSFDNNIKLFNTLTEHSISITNYLSTKNNIYHSSEKTVENIKQQKQKSQNFEKTFSDLEYNLLELKKAFSSISFKSELKQSSQTLKDLADKFNLLDADGKVSIEETMLLVTQLPQSSFAEFKKYYNYYLELSKIKFHIYNEYITALTNNV